MDKTGTLHAPDALCLRQLIGQARNPANGNLYEVSIMPGGMPHILSRVAGLQWSASWDDLVALAIEAGIDQADGGQPSAVRLPGQPPAVAADSWPGRPPFGMGDRVRSLQEKDPRRVGIVNYDDGRQILIRWRGSPESEGLDAFSYEAAAKLLRLQTEAEDAAEAPPPAPTRIPAAQMAPPEGLVLTPGPAVSGAVAKGTAAPACSHPATTPQGGVLRDGAPASPPHPFQDRHDACAREGCELTRRTHDLQIVSDPNLHAFEERPAAPAHPFQGSNDACAREGCGAARYQHSPKHGPGWISHPFEEWAAENERTDEPTPRHNTDMDPLEKHLRTDDCWRCPACGDEQEEASHAAPCKREACGGAYLRHFRDPKAQAAQLEGSE